VPEEINLDVFNADPITEDVSDEALLILEEG